MVRRCHCSTSDRRWDAPRSRAPNRSWGREPRRHHAETIGLNAAQDALKAGDFAEYGRRITALEQALTDLQRLQQQ